MLPVLFERRMTSTFPPRQPFLPYGEAGMARETAAGLAGIAGGACPRADLGRGDVETETVWGNFREKVGITARHRDIVEPAHAPCPVGAHGHQKAGPGIGDLLERRMHLRRV